MPRKKTEAQNGNYKSGLEGIHEIKKKGIILGVVIIAVVAICIYLLARPKALGNMSNSYSEQVTITSDISFFGKAGERIKFSFRSNIVSGDLDMVLYDSLGNEVYILDKTWELETFFTLDSTDTYTLEAECNNFIGEYKIPAYRADLSTSYWPGCVKTCVKGQWSLPFYAL